MEVDHEDLDMEADIERIEINHREGTIVVTEDPEGVNLAVSNSEGNGLMMDAGKLTVWHEGDTSQLLDNTDE